MNITPLCLHCVVDRVHGGGTRSVRMNETLPDSYLIQTCDRSFVYSKCLQKCHVLAHMSVLDYFYSITAKYPLSACMHPLRQWNGCINDALFQCCFKSVADAVTIYCADIISHGAVTTQKRQLSSNMNLSNRNTC